MFENKTSILKAAQTYALVDIGFLIVALLFSGPALAQNASLKQTPMITENYKIPTPFSGAQWITPGRAPLPDGKAHPTCGSWNW